MKISSLDIIGHRMTSAIIVGYPWTTLDDAEQCWATLDDVGIALNHDDQYRTMILFSFL